MPVDVSRQDCASVEDVAFGLCGYAACLAATGTFAIALHAALTAPSLLSSGDRTLLAAVLAAAASVLGAVSATFELWRVRRARQSSSVSIPLATGLMAGVLLLALTGQCGAFAWIVIAAVGLRAVMLVYKAGVVRAALPVLAGSLVGYWMFLLSFVDGYKTPWIEEAIVSGTVHVDLLFHAAIANMLSNYGVGSMGIDGLRPFPYHFGSHRLITLLCDLLDIGPLQFYSVVFPLLFSPMLLVFLFFFVQAYRAFLLRVSYGEGGRAEAAGWFWVVFAISFVGLISVQTRRTLGVWDNIFHSESFGIAVLVSFLAGIWIFERLGRNGPLRLPWYAFPAIALYLALLCTLKISVGMVIGSLLAYLLLRLPVSWAQRIAAGLAIALALGYGLSVTRMPTHDVQAGPSLLEMVKPFAFLRDIVEPRLRWLSFLAFFGPLLALISLRVMRARGARDGSLWSRAVSACSIDVELAVVLTAVSVAPGLLLSVPQGGTNFFAEVSYWWVQPMLAVVLARTLAAIVNPQRIHFSRF